MTTNQPVLGGYNLSNFDDSELEKKIEVIAEADSNTFQQTAAVLGGTKKDNSIAEATLAKTFINTITS